MVFARYNIHGKYGTAARNDFFNSISPFSMHVCYLVKNIEIPRRTIKTTKELNK